MSGLVPLLLLVSHTAVAETYHLPLLPSGADSLRQGIVRIVNHSASAGEVTVTAIDDSGRYFGPVTLNLEARAAIQFSSTDLERGNETLGITAGIGHGQGDWRLIMNSELDIEPLSYAETTAGFIDNLHDIAARSSFYHRVALSAPDSLNTQGETLRLMNLSHSTAEIVVFGVDDTGDPASGLVVLSLPVGTSQSISTSELENGAPGLIGRLNDGEGDWRLNLQSDLNLDLFSNARTQDGIVTVVDDTAATSDRRHHVPLFRPARENQQISQLRLINPSADPAEIRIQGWDDAGLAASGGAVTLTLPSGTTHTISATALEEGADELVGSFGRGEGNWRLLIEADREIRVISLVKSSKGHVTNLSTSSIHPRFLDSCVGGPVDADDDGITDHCDSDPQTTLRPLGACADGTFVGSPGLLPGLASDCRVLIGFANYQAQSDSLPDDHALRHWGFGAQERIDDWSGINLSFFGLRVTEIRLRGSENQPSGLTGSIPPQLGALSELTALDLAYNQLSGFIPPELGQLANLNDLFLANNQLTGPIPPELGRLANLRQLWLSGNRLTGVIPPEFGRLNQLEYLSVSNNHLTGTLPWALWERAARDELEMYYGGNTIQGVAQPPQRSSPVYSGTPASNGNATHHSVSHYQGPLTWEWNWTDVAVEHQRPLLGRWAALAVRVDHEVATPPLVITRVLDGGDTVLVERLNEAVPPSTVSTGEGKWRTEYVFDLPGELYQPGYQLVHVIDPDNDLAETNEDDNVGMPIRLYGDRPPPFRVTFIPIHAPGDEAPSVDPVSLMAGTWAYLPIRDDFQAMIAPPLRSDAVDKYELLDEIRALWNVEADAEEFYYGVFHSPWPGVGDRAARAGGLADRPGRIAVSTVLPHFPIPHEIGHNLSLRHPSGCGAGEVDQNYPYLEGGLGPDPGWDVNWRRFVSDDDEGFADVMSYCRTQSFVSDYHYRKASDYWLGTASATSSFAAQPPVSGISPRGLGPANQSSPVSGQAVPETEGVAGLALSGRIDATGAWSLTHVQLTEKGSRPPPDANFTLILFDGNGTELYREPLTPSAVSEGDEGGWAARIPIPLRPAREVIILDPQGATVLHDELPLLE